MELALDLSKPKEKLFTYADFLTWVDDIRRELVDGFVKVMASARPPHVRVGRRLIGSLDGIIAVRGCGCEVYYDMDVLFTEDGSRDPRKAKTVLCPDVIVVCDESKIDDAAGCWGSPDLVIEIQSPGTAHYDMHRKYEIYERYGVREYWVVHPTDHWVRVFTPDGEGKYGDGVLYERGVSVPVGIFGSESIELTEIFK